MTKPVYRIGDATLMLGCCIDVMRTMQESSVDLVLADLPYGTTQNRWDTVVPLDAMWRELRRICTGPVVLTACQPFSSALVMSNPKEFRHDWVWEKNKSSGHLNANRRPMRVHEDVLVFSKAAPQYNPQITSGHNPGHYAKRAKNGSNYGHAELTEWGGTTNRYPRSVLKFGVVNNDDDSKWHPTQKPVDLMAYFIKTYSQAGATVLDICMGSGSTGHAALQAGRKFIGIEKDADIFNRATADFKAVHKRLAA